MRYGSVCSGIEVHNKDCFEFMAGVKDQTFEVAITSPPYNMNLRVRAGKYCSRQVIAKEFSSKYQSFDDNLPMEEYRDFLLDTLRELLRISKLVFFNIQMITGNKPALFSVLGELSQHIKELVIWDKGCGQPAMKDRTMNSRFELLLVLSADTSDAMVRQFEYGGFDRGTLDNVWEIGRGAKASGSHGAAFPVALPETILRNFVKPGSSVFDPFTGTGSTAIAAHRAGCAFVGTEIDTDYYREALARIERETSQADIFG